MTDRFFPHPLVFRAGLAFTIILMLGCNRVRKPADGNSKSSADPQQLAYKSTADVKKRLTIGMSTNRVLASLGKPNSVSEVENRVIWRYALSPFLADDEMRGTEVVGLILNFTNGWLASFGYSYASRTERRSVDDLLADNKNGINTQIKFFPVSDASTAGGTFVDTARFPKLGHIAQKPALVIDGVREITLEERNRTEPGEKSVWVFSIFLTKTDAAQFRSFTEANVSKQILVMVGEEIVATPTIVMAIETGSFEIGCNDRGLMEVTKRELAKVKRVP